MSETSVSIKSNKAVADGSEITISGIMRGYFGRPARIVSIEVTAGQHGTGDNAPAGAARKDGFKVTADAPSSDWSVTIDSNNNTRPGTFTHGAAVSVQVKGIDAYGNEVGGEQTMLQVYDPAAAEAVARAKAAAKAAQRRVALAATYRLNEEQVAKLAAIDDEALSWTEVGEPTSTSTRSDMSLLNEIGASTDGIDAFTFTR
ncbi:hypothetical protein ACFWCB_05310 [Streptomyces sp. NPDC060048]|uniref:hypothetical protein n=1 Tax=unclassified Streptomyces TaxID=2593676 RepID=UPI0036A2850D